MATVWDRIKDRFDLEKQVTFYMSYHYDKTNQYIHFTCIWPILITALMLAADLTPAFIATPEWLANLPLGAYFVFNLSAIGALVYMVWYIALDYIAGSLGAFLVFWIFIFSNYMAQTAPANFGVSSWVIALPIHVAAWIAQFIGHGVYERRRPALLDSLDQALITAPMFVLLEVLFSFGYRKDMYDRVMTQVRINVLAYHGKEAFEQIFGEKIPLVGTAA